MTLACEQIISAQPEAGRTREHSGRSCSHLRNAPELLAEASCPSVFFSSSFELEICYETQLLKIALNSPKKSQLSTALKYSERWDELVKLVKVSFWVYPMPRPILPLVIYPLCHRSGYPLPVVYISHWSWLAVILLAIKIVPRDCRFPRRWWVDIKFVAS